MKRIILILAMLLSLNSVAEAAWVSTPTSGQVVSVRTYDIGPDALRAQITVSGASHDCGTTPNIFYFDTGNISAGAVKAILSLAFGAMAAGKPVIITYDCSLNVGGGYGWGVALSVKNN